MEVGAEVVDVYSVQYASFQPSRSFRRGEGSVLGDHSALKKVETVRPDG